MNWQGDILAPPALLAGSGKRREVSGQSGVGMLEFLIALLIFSTGILGLLSMQLAGKKAGHEASQRSVATALARDILERMRANPGHLYAYQATSVGGDSEPLPVPATDCDISSCSAVELAVFDLWQWESLLLGESEKYSGSNAGGLLSPRACITNDGGAVAVAISWLGVMSARPSVQGVCGGDEDDAGDDNSVNGELHRRQLQIETFIGTGR